MTCAFLFFSRDKRGEVKELNPEMKNTDVSAELGRMWANLTDEEKQPYIERSLKDRERYMCEKNNYEKMHTSITNNNNILNNNNNPSSNQSNNNNNNPSSSSPSSSNIVVDDSDHTSFSPAISDQGMMPINISMNMNINNMNNIPSIGSPMNNQINQVSIYYYIIIYYLCSTIYEWYEFVL